MSENKKTGATPLVDEDSLRGGEVLGALPVKPVLVKYRDGHGKEEVRLAVVIPGGEVYFFEAKALDLHPAQKWLKAGVLGAIKE